jgi:Asp-tRNA(Asn)/Glu-tRNA(Gln) amidotransferase A subunit family amidase
VTVPTPEEQLEQAEIEIARDADARELEGVDRRSFVFHALVAAAAGVFGSAAHLRGQAATGAAQTPPPAVPRYPLSNGEPLSWTFQPYPGGTGAVMERLIRERGARAFERRPLAVERWSGVVPMSDEDLAFLPAHRLSALIKERRITSTRLTRLYLDRIIRLNPTLLCAVTIMEAQALAEAARADAEIKAGRYRGPLHGLPYGLKDLFSTRGVPTTWGARDFEHRVIDEDAEIAVRLREAGAVLIAKLATGLFAQNDQWFRGRTNNPWNLSQGSSGSSAGPASATAAGCVAFSIGTETQGSIVSPSIRCGITALRPTFGRVSRYGGMVLAWSQDRVGPMCRTAEDCAMVFSVIHGVDEKDPSTVTTPFEFDRHLRLSTLRIGIDDRTPNGAPPALVAILKDLGARLQPIGARPPQAAMNGTGFLSSGGLNTEYAAAFDDYVQRKAREIGLDLSALPETPPAGRGRGAGAGGGPADPMAPADWNPRFVNGRTVRAFDFLQVQRRRQAYIAEWAAFMKDLDLFVGAPQADTAPNAQTGHPCVVVPYAFDVPAAGGAGRGGGGGAETPAVTLKPQPICGVLTGALYKDDVLLAVAHQVQMSRDVHRRRPEI